MSFHQQRREREAHAAQHPSPPKLETEPVTGPGSRVGTLGPHVTGDTGGYGGSQTNNADVKPKKQKLAPNTPEHKADRWEKYQARGGKKPHDGWGKQYDINMRNYQHGLQRESEYRTAMGASEGMIKTPLTNRQIDILHANEMYAGQLKTGPVSLTMENAVAIQKDAELVKRGWEVEHILEKGASKPYLAALDKAGVKYHIGSKI